MLVGNLVNLKVGDVPRIAGIGPNVLQCSKPSLFSGHAAALFCTTWFTSS